MVPELQLLSQPLMERQRTGLRTAVIHHLTQRHETSHAGNRNHMAVVLLDHVWKELPDSHEVRDCVHLEGLPDLVLGFLEDGPVMAYTGVVDEDRGFSVCLTDLVSHGLQAG